jgi:hypothetical protein
VDETLENLDPLHRRLAEQYLRSTPWASAGTAAEATAFEAASRRAEEEEKDAQFEAMLARLYPEFRRIHDEFARAIAEGREPVVPARPPRHQPPPRHEPVGIEPGPALPALGLPKSGAARAAYGRISAAHGERALRYLRRNDCTWDEAVDRTREGG